jgi:hypothetical protein
MVFRSQVFQELCGACREPAPGACPRCQTPLCASHAFPPEGCCEGCAVEIYLTVSRAGKNHVTAGTVLGGVATGLFYLCWYIHYLPVSVLAVVALGFCASLISIFWGGVVAPRLADRRLRRELGRARVLVRAALPEPESSAP